jgi:hypothetical protein
MRPLLMSVQESTVICRPENAAGSGCENLTD